MERNRPTEQLDILLQEFPHLERIIVVIDGNRHADTRDYTERTLDELSQYMDQLFITYLQLINSFLPKIRCQHKTPCYQYADGSS